MKYLRKTAVLLFWLLVWFLLGRIMSNSLVLVGPDAVFLALCRLLPSADFWFTIAQSFLRIGLGFLSGFFCGMLFGALAYRFPLLAELLSPLISLMKAVPVASFVILALIFMGSKNLAFLIVLILVVPVVYHNTLSGFQSTDRQLLEMAQVFRIPGWKRLTGIYRPTVRPFLISAAQTAIGMSWKSGVAAEVIGVSAGSIGEKLYLSKIYLETAELFAWTIVIIALSWVCEKMFVKFLKTCLGV